MSELTDVHELVSDTYTRAVAGASCGCCSGGAPKGAIARTAGYDPADLAAIPSDAVSNSFGCGNPLSYADVQPGQVVLDLGSGAGIDLLLAARMVGPTGRVIGVDMTDAMIARARENIAAAGLANVEVRKGLIEALPVETASVDWVISNCVINLSPDKPRVFSEIARVLRSGGRMRVSDIVVEALPDELRNSPALYTSCVAGAISEAKYLDGLRRAGLSDVSVRDRLIYTAEQLVALAGAVDGGIVPCDLLQAVVGKIWSAAFVASKPSR